MARQRTCGRDLANGPAAEGSPAILAPSVAEGQRPSIDFMTRFGLGGRPAPVAGLSSHPVRLAGPRDQGEASQRPRSGAGVGGAASAAAMPHT